MPDPEIDRRCIMCGASVRARALYCPQCGQPVGNHRQPSQSSADDNATTNIAESSPTVRLVGPDATDLSETQPLTAAPDLSETQPLTATPNRSETQPLSAFSPAVPDKTPPAKKFLTGKDENVIGRVEKIRKVSIVVIDLAAYDPSLRFLLVAAGLFLMFLLLLILSKVIG